MNHILNLNPSLDYFLECDEFELNQTNRSKKESIAVGGKGSNVSMLLNNLEIHSTLHGFVGGFVGDYISESLKELQYVKNDMIDTKLLTRINVKLTYEGETEINGSGKAINDDHLKALEAQLTHLNESDVLVMGGSVANGMSFNWYLEMAQKMHKQGAEFIIDINNPILKEILKYQPLLIKPNEDEVKNIFNHEGDLTQSDIMNYGKEMLVRGAQNVIISLGSEGSMFFVKEKVYKSENLKRELISAVGAGDSMIGGFLAEYQRSKDPLKAYKRAQACGNATAFSKDIASKEMIEEIEKHIEIKEIIDGN